MLWKQIEEEEQADLGAEPAEVDESWSSDEYQEGLEYYYPTDVPGTAPLPTILRSNLMFFPFLYFL